MRAKTIVLAMAVLGTACKGGASETPTEPITTCYSGTATYGTSEVELVAASTCDASSEAGCTAPTPLLLRRTLQPQDSTIAEEWVEGQSKSTFASKSTVLAKVDKDRYEYEVVLDVDPRGDVKQSTWTGVGKLEGEPWQWTSWTASQERLPPGTDVISTKVSGDTIERSVDYTQADGSVDLRRRDSLKVFDCAEWDARSDATLTAAPVRHESETPETPSAEPGA